MTRLSDPDDDAFGSQGPKFSPDGKRFAIVLKKGDLEHDTNEYTLNIFKTNDVFSTPRPEVVLTMSSSSNRDAIKGLKWLTDDTVAFIGEDGGRAPQVYEFNVRTKRRKAITHHPTPIIAFDISDDRRTLVFEATEPERDPIDSERTRREGFVVTAENLARVLVETHRDRLDSLQLFLQVGRSKSVKIPLHDQITPDMAPSVSPDGHFALIEVFAREVPEVWSGYKDSLLHQRIVTRRQPGGDTIVPRYLLLDTKTGVLEPLMDAPKPYSHDEFAWGLGGRSVLLSDAHLPLGTGSPDEREARETKTFVVEVKLPSKEIVVLSDQPMKVARWDRVAQQIILRARSGEPGTAPKAFEYRAGRWKEVAPVASTNPLAITCEEGLNSPPQIFVAQPNGTNKTLLVDLNPQFRELQFGKVEAVHWMSTDGHEFDGGLYLPPDYKAGLRYPLVIQLSGFNKDQFWIDGKYGSAYAAQPLAAKGIIVLQVGRNGYHEYVTTTMEGPRQMASYEGAIDYLDRRGMVDRNRIGIIGFSRPVYPAVYTLTHSKYDFAAATLAEGFDGGYWQFLAAANASPELSAVNGGPPLGDSGLSLWMKNSPGFNLYKINTPIRLESYSRASVIGQWERYSLLWQMGKPVDFILLPDGSHPLVKPLDRMVSLQGNVDWFAFWLKGEEDPDPRKREQYRRWRDLRRLQEQQDKAVAATD